MNRHLPVARAPRAAGFTLVEIMVVVVILGLLATIVGSNVLGRSAKAEVSTAEINISQLKDTVDQYMIENRRRIPTWEDLLTPDRTGHKWIQREDPQLDPWGNEYVITFDPDYEQLPFIVSWGPDGLEGTDDDIDSKSITRNDEG
ncbi:MAG: type II secretion system protein GspG [Planctomycetota bacterium]